MRRIRRAYHCKCGASFAISGPPDVVEKMIGELTVGHSGPGHGETIARVAAAARRRADRAKEP